ncbi:hypothetical protein Ae201684P_008679 [Aphanomyces euteiches]|nr:hypothetical protein Ae201684P_008679 [Aphanomyces euteiches]
MPRKKGVIWTFFNDLPDDESSRLKMSRVECRYCKGNVVKSTSRLRSHLRICPNFDGSQMPPMEEDDDDDGLPEFRDAKMIKDDGKDAFHPLSRYIDHTLLKPEATPSDITVLCREAHEHGFYSVCVSSVFAAHARQSRDESEAKQSPCQSVLRAFEANHCLAAGAEEIDMVIPVGYMKAGDHSYVLRDISAVVLVCKKYNAVCKVILETALLTETEIETASHLAISAGADFLKTSTGFGARGASLHDVQIMGRIAHPRNVQVKASGGIRTVEDAQHMIQAGATRLGSSSGIAIVHPAVVLPPTEYNMAL